MSSSMPKVVQENADHQSMLQNPDGPTAEASAEQRGEVGKEETEEEEEEEEDNEGQDEDDDNDSSEANDDPNAPRPIYDRTEIIDTIMSFYKLLIRLPYIPPEALLLPPALGWPTINPTTFASMNKTLEVVALLAKLPYLDIDGQDYWIAPSTSPIDYRGARVAAALAKGFEFYEKKSSLVPFGIEIPAWVVPLTAPERYGTALLLDTRDGTITEFIPGDPFYSSQPRYPASDPRNWRNASPTRSLPASKFFSRWADLHEKLLWIGWPMNGWPCVREEGTNASEDEMMELRNIHRAHGWPDDFRREECRRALEQWESDHK